MWYNELELEYYIEQQAISHMWYNELELESIIDDFFQGTFDKLDKIEKPKPKDLQINDDKEIFFKNEKKTGNNNNDTDFHTNKIYFVPESIYGPIQIDALQLIRQTSKFIFLKKLKKEFLRDNVIRVQYNHFYDDDFVKIKKKDMTYDCCGTINYNDSNSDIIY